VYDDLSSRTMPNGTTPLNLSSLNPVASLRPNENGVADASLPPGAYSVVYRNCFVVEYDFRIGTICCPHVDASPRLQQLRTDSGDWVSDYQPVEIVEGAATTATLIGRPEPRPSRNEVRLIALLCLGLVVGGAALFSVTRLRPRFNPKSDPDNPVSLPPDPNYRPADFDDVFGEFLKRQ
jgi:hypothetical protein